MAFYDYIPFVQAGKGYQKGANWVGKQLEPSQLSSLDPQQQKLYDSYQQAIMGGGGPLADIYGFDPEQIRDLYTQQYAEPAYQQFQEEVVPGITGQFRGQNLENSSYAAGAVGKAGRDVQSNLNAQLANMLYNAEQQSLQRKQGGINQLLNMQTFAYQQSPLMQLLQGLAGGAGKAVGGTLFG